MADALAADPAVVVFGEDVGTLGGVFRITDGLTRDFGDERCFDTPLAESGIMGMAIGMAMNGMKPVVEMQFDAFAYPAFEQVVSHVAKMPNRTKGKIKLPWSSASLTPAGSAEWSTTATPPRPTTCTLRA